MDWTPEFSRRARGFTVYAAIRQLGRCGIAELVERCCDHAARFAREIESTGAEVLNEVVLNQVLFRFETEERTAGSAPSPGERRGVDERDDLGRPAGDPPLGQQLADERRGHRPDARRLSRGGMSELAIRLRGVVKRYGEIAAVNGLDLDVPYGTCVGLLGPNGAGKSTTMRLLTAQAIADERRAARPRLRPARRVERPEPTAG